MAQAHKQTFIFTSYLDCNDFEYCFFPDSGNVTVMEGNEKDLEHLVNDVHTHLDNFHEIDRLRCER